MINKDKILSLSNTCLEILNASQSFDMVSKEILEVLCRGFSCDWGTYWKVDSVEYVLKPFQFWSSNQLHASLLLKDTSNRSLTLSEGNAGHVWRSRTPIWSTDIARDMCIPRSLDAVGVGLTGGLWFALKTENGVYGVIELLGQKFSGSSPETILDIENLGMKLGSYFESDKNK